MEAMKVAFGYSPADEGGVMFCGLAAGRIETGELEVKLISAPLPALNDRASRGELEATMISAAVYPYLRSRYVLARCGASFASGGGPVLAAREPMGEDRLAKASVAVPDSTSSATMALQLSRPGMRTRLLPADKITQAAKMGLADCALLAHSDAAACRRSGLYCVADVAFGWAESTGNLPLPLTCLAIRSDLAPEVRLGIEEALRASIRYTMEHPAEAARFLRNNGTNGSAPLAGAALDPGAYVSESALGIDDPQRRALEEFFRRGCEARLLPNALPLEFADGR
ncbi:MAG TPA: MqnA/MqnD/SBP family protein [Phycisphaerae bacterium]|nr:MqnA/MqnD/SBP family protein [Phycisphaerae bacterium]